MALDARLRAETEEMAGAMSRAAIERGLAEAEAEGARLAQRAAERAAPRDRVLTGKDGRRWFVCGASGRAVQLVAKGERAR